MPAVIAYSLIVLALIGHAVFWIALVNRIHALAWPRWIVDLLTFLCGVVLVVVPAVFAWFCWQRGFEALLPRQWSTAPVVTWILVAWFAFVAVAAGFRELRFNRHADTANGLVSNHTSVIDLKESVDEPLMGRGLPALLARLPRNEVLRPHIHEKQIALPRLPIGGDGIKIAHLTDLHMSGRIRRPYFEEIVRHVNEWQPDLVALTGDLVERSRCLDWISGTLGQLSAPGGVYFVLGNHDRHVDCSRLRKLLVGAGFTDLGGRWCRAEVRQTDVVLAGNELPWFPPAADMSDCPPHNEMGLPLRILLSHSPDQFTWGQDQEMDLILAGHCHGGQVRFPVVGAILSPSMHGTRYSAGLFRSGSTVMHVSRGTSGHAPFRWNCPPEVALLTLRKGST